MPLFTTHTGNEPRCYSVYLFRAQNLKTNDFTKLLVTLTRPVIRRHLISQVMQTGSTKYSGVWRPTSVGSYSRTLPYPRLNLSMEKKALSLLRPLCSLLAGGDEVQGGQARGHNVWAGSRVPGDLASLQPRSAANPAPALASSSPRSSPRAGRFRMTKSPTAPTASGPRHFRPRPAELQAPAAPAQGPPPPTSAQNESQNPPRDARPRNRTKPADGGGGTARVAKDTGEGGLCAGAGSPIWPSLYPYLPPACWTRRPRPVLRAPGKRRKVPARLPRGLLPRGPQPLSPASPSRPSPHSRANLRLRIRSSFAVQSRRRNAAHKPFPRSPRRGLLPVCGSQEAEGGEAPRCHGDALRAGEGRRDDKDRFEAALGLGPLCSERPGFCVPPPRRGRERILPLRQSLRLHEPSHAKLSVTLWKE